MSRMPGLLEISSSAGCTHARSLRDNVFSKSLTRRADPRKRDTSTWKFNAATRTNRPMPAQMAPRRPVNAAANIDARANAIGVTRTIVKYREWRL